MAFEDWRDWKPWALLGITTTFVIGSWATITFYGGAQCVNDYDYNEGYEGGCFGGLIYFRGHAAIALFSALGGALAMPWIIHNVMGVPKIPELIARSGWKRKQLFRWLEKRPRKPNRFLLAIYCFFMEPIGHLHYSDGWCTMGKWCPKFRWPALLISDKDRAWFIKATERYA